MTPADQELLLAVPEHGSAPSLETSGAEARETAVTLRGLHKSFGSQGVLDGIDLTLNDGETLAMLGRSGTGKSVLLKLIIGLQKPDSGSVLVHGQDIAHLDLDALNEIRKK